MVSLQEKALDGFPTSLFSSNLILPFPFATRIMSRFTLATAAGLLAVAQVALAQGDPEALSDLNYNRPTKTWSQWQPKATYAIDELPDQYMGSNRIPEGFGGTPGGEPQTGYNT